VSVLMCSAVYALVLILKIAPYNVCCAVDTGERDDRRATVEGTRQGIRESRLD
jgi:hypothetical protein